MDPAAVDPVAPVEPVDTFFPRREWTYRRCIKAGLHVMHAHTTIEGDVAFTYAERVTVGMRGTVVMVSKHGSSDFWLRARHLSSEMSASWQMRNNHVGKMEFRSTGYHDGMGPCVCQCVGGKSPLYEYLVEAFGQSFPGFARAARAAIMNEIRNHGAPRRLFDMLPGAGLKAVDIEAVVDTNRDYELPESVGGARA